MKIHTLARLCSFLRFGAICALSLFSFLAQAQTVLVHYAFGAVGTQTDPIYDTNNFISRQLNPTNVPTVNANQIVEGGDNQIGGAGDSTIALKTASTGSPPNYPYLQAYAGNSAANSGTASGTALTTALQAETNNCYFTFTLGGVGTNTLNLASLTFNGQNGGSGLRGFSIQESVDGFSTNGATDFASQTTNSTYRGESQYGSSGAYTAYSYPLTAAKFQGLSSITFRIFVFAQTTGSSIEFDNIEVNGTVVGTMTSVPENDAWVGNLSTNWDLSGALNWTTNGAAVGNYGFNNNDTVFFYDSASGFSVNVATNVSPASIIVSNNTHNYAFSSVGTFTGNAIANNTPLTKSGTGTLKLGMSSVFGATAVSNGVVDLGGNNQTVGLLSGSGVITNSGAGTPILTIGNGGPTNTYTGLFVGAIGISQVGGGLVLANANSYTGPTTNAAGTLQVSGATGLGDSSGVTITGGVLNLTNATVSCPVTFNPGGVGEPLTEEGPSAVNIISGAVTIADGAAYTVEVNSVAGVSTGAYLYFTGGIFADTNSVLIVDDNSGNSDPGNIWIQNTPMNLGSGSLKGYGWHINVAGNIVGTINPFYGRSASLDVDNAFANVPALVMGAPASVAVTYGKLNLNGHNLTVSSLTSVGTASTSDEITSATNAFLDVSNNVSCAYVGILTGVGLGLVKDGPGTLTLGSRVSANTYANATTIKAGTLALTNAVTITNSANISVASGATFDVSAMSSAFALVKGQTLTGSGLVTGAVTSASGAVIAAGTGGIGTLSFSSSLTLNAASTNNFFVTTAGGSSNKVVVAGQLLPNSSVVSVTSGTALHPGTYPLFTYGSVSGTFNPAVVFDVAPVHAAFIMDNGAGQINLVVTNHLPVAAPMSVSRTAGLSLVIALSGLAANWSDADGDTVTLAGINLVTTNGVKLMTNSNWILYTNGPNVNDQISYSISDGWGGTNIGYINVMVNSSVTGSNSIVGVTMGGTNVVKAYGIPGFNYILERATNLAPALWVDVSTNAAAANGVINATDTFNDLGNVPPGSAYYRLKWQP